MEAMARSIGDEGRYESAIDWMQKALEAFYQTNGLPTIDAYLISHIALWKQYLGDYAGAMETAKMFVTPRRAFWTGEQIELLTTVTQGMGKEQSQLARCGLVCALSRQS